MTTETNINSERDQGARQPNVLKSLFGGGKYPKVIEEAKMNKARKKN
jgi:hypothetical protein